MAYNGGFPINYQPIPYYQPVFQQQQSQPQQPSINNNLIWVQGEAGAKSYLVAPNTTVQLWDSEAQRIFLKSADASGMPSMKILDYTIRNQTPANAPVAASVQHAENSTAYATRAEIDALTARIDALRAEMDGISKKGATLNE